jgi:hypothetical protein
MGKISSGYNFILILICFLSFNPILGQNEKGELVLHDIFIQLESRYEIQFNFAEDNIEGINIIPPSENLSLNEALDYLRNQTGLAFRLMNSNFVLVKLVSEKVICGYIRDKDNLQPLAHATVQGEFNSTITDDNGFFKLTLNQNNELIIIRHLGFKTIERSFNNFNLDQCSDIFLIPFAQSLEEVFISNYIVKGINKVNNGSYQLDITNFEILPGQIDNDVLRSVQAFPGIQSINETVSNINIRGGTHDQNLILWDQIKMYQSGHFFGLISMYNPQITHKVTLMKNGSDVRYTDGVSGTISMETDKNLTTKFKGNIGVNLIDANGFVDMPTGKNSSIQVAARKSISEFIQTPTYDKYFERISQDTEVANNASNIVNSDKAFDFYDASLRWIYKISDSDEIRLNFINVSNELIFDENAIIDGNQESRKSSLTQNSIAGALYYSRIWNDRWRTSFEVYETDYKLKAINVNILDSQRFLQENKVSETSLKLIADHKLNDQLHLKGGYHFVETEVTNLDDVDVPRFRLLVSEVVRTHGVFSQIAYVSENGNTNVNLGVRFNHIDKFNKQIIEPRFSLTQRFLNDFTLEVLGEFKNQVTSQVINFQNDFLGVEKRRWQLSDDDTIPVLISKQFSVGLNYENQGWLVSAEGYFKNVDGITTQSQGFQNQYEFIKSHGAYEAYGLDFLLRKRIDTFNSWLSYAFMNNQYTFPDLSDTSFPSNYDITHALTFGTSYTINKLKIAAGLNWHSGKPTTSPVEGNEIVDGEVNYGSTNSNNLNEYLRLDVSSVYEFKLGSKTRAEVGASVWNILNNENVINNFYRINNETVTETKQSSLGISPNALIRVYFN